LSPRAPRGWDVKESEWACKPGSVRLGCCQGGVIISLGRRLPVASSSPPERKPERVAPGRRERRTPSCSALLLMGFTKPNRSPGLLVSSYLTVSPLPLAKAGGGLFSAALSLAFRPVGVTHHHTLWSPDFPPAAFELAQKMLRILENSRRSPGPLRFLEKIVARPGPAGKPSADSPREATFRTRHLLASYV